VSYLSNLDKFQSLVREPEAGLLAVHLVHEIWNKLFRSSLFWGVRQHWMIVIDVSGQPVDPIFKDPIVQEFDLPR